MGILRHLADHQGGSFSCSDGIAARQALRLQVFKFQFIEQLRRRAIQRLPLGEAVKNL